MEMAMRMTAMGPSMEAEKARVTPVAEGTAMLLMGLCLSVHASKSPHL
jgi:hypothetical protein